jgi:hypothetical protein
VVAAAVGKCSRQPCLKLDLSIPSFINVLGMYLIKYRKMLKGVETLRNTATALFHKLSTVLGAPLFS